MPRILNEALRSRQQQQREHTYQLIDDGMQVLRDEGREITNTNFVEVTGLARSTFSKEHVKRFLLEKYGIGAKSPILFIKSGELVPALEYNKLLKRLELKAEELRKSEETLKCALRKNKVAKDTIKALDHENKILRGQLDISMNRIRLLTPVKQDNPDKLIRVFPVNETEPPV